MNLVREALSLLSGQAYSSRLAITGSVKDRLYKSPPSILSYFPWVSYCPINQVFEFEDGLSVGAVFELTPMDAESRGADYLATLRNAWREALAEVPDRAENPWVMQFYTQDDVIAPFEKSLKGYRCDPEYTLTRFVIDRYQEHFDTLSDRSGIFADRESRWRGLQRRVRIALYRKTSARERRNESPVDELNTLVERLFGPLHMIGCRPNRCSGKDVYEWLFPTLNPSPVEGCSPQSYVQRYAYPVSAEKTGTLPLDFDVPRLCFEATPQSDGPEDGRWKIGNAYHQYVAMGSLTTSPQIGHICLEQQRGGDTAVPSLLDMLPVGAMVVQTITFSARAQVESQISKIAEAAAGRGPQALQAKQQAQDAIEMMSHEHAVYRINHGVFLSAGSTDVLEEQVLRTVQLCRNYQLNPINQQVDYVAQHSFLTQMPMCYEPSRDRIEKRSHLAYGHHTASLLPVYGRGRGSGNPGMIFFNRSGEPLMLDPFRSSDRARVAHGVILGPTGTGKSAQLTQLIELWMAIHRPRMFVIESGNSFGLLAQHLATQDVDVRHIKLNLGESQGLSPFQDAWKLVEEADSSEDLNAVIESSLQTSDEPEEAPEDVIERDILGEMEMSLRLMATGGEWAEEQRLTRADRYLLREAILIAASAALSSYNKGERHYRDTLAEDIAAALLNLSEDEDRPQRRRERAYELYEQVQLFTEGLEGQFFNRPGESWPDADVTIVDLDRFARVGSEDKLAVVMTGLLNRINDIAESTQMDGRPIIVVIDEAHVVTTNPLLGPYIATIGKMWRKLKTWLWLATQNMEDFKDDAKKMLSMAEFWIVLSPSEDEIEGISRFRKLTSEQKYMLRDTRRESGKYVEGVILSEKFNTLFRSVLPAHALALAGTEGEEKKLRQDIQEELACDELSAAYEVARRIQSQREASAR